ncbi:MAG: carbohydrate ABC transporter permease [Turicibacter sp.]
MKNKVIKAKKRLSPTSIIVGCVVIVIGILISLPFVWMILTSFKQNGEIMAIPPTLFPETPTFQNYIDLFSKMNFMVYLKNTLILVAFAFGGMFLNAMAGYSFAKFNFPGKEKFFLVVLATMMIPSQVTMIPVYLMLNGVGLTNTILGIALPGLVAGFSIFLFRQFMSTIPTEVIEAARLEGASELKIFFKIIIPMAKPIFAVQGILTFIGAWNSFLWPLIMANEEKLYTLSVGLSLLKGQNTSEYGIQMAGAALMVIPILIIFMFLQKHIIDGYNMSGMK